ncbi:MAG TPA: hypothetical protein DCR40_00905 [Prolixibacteraceae bacterium]|nr:hypothetical protein [Prolixibacteraceae bacterium]
MKLNRSFFLVLFVALLLSILFSCKKDVVKIDTPITPSESGTVADIDGNVYHTVKIGTQTWMVENLKTTKYNDGISIPYVTDNKIWESLVTPGYCWYNNNIGFKNPYGALYNWYAINTGKLAPKGWHVPSDSEWTILVDYLGGKAIASAKLRESGTMHWTNSNTGTNETGFTALPGSNRSSSGTFFSIGLSAYWWNSSEFSTNNQTFGGFRNMGNATDIGEGSSVKQSGFSIRCVKD